MFSLKAIINLLAALSAITLVGGQTTGTTTTTWDWYVYSSLARSIFLTCYIAASPHADTPQTSLQVRNLPMLV